MKKSSIYLALFCVLVLASCASAGILDTLKSPAEESNWERTTSSQEVVDYVKLVAANSGGRIRYEDMAYTVYNRPLPLAIVGIPAAPKTPAEVGNRIVIHVQCNIHSGEVEGKEASLIWLREIAQGKHDVLLKDIVLTVNSNFNPDGNDALGTWRTGSQPTPRMVGTRTNAQGYNLNRDFVKLDSPEARGHLRNFRKWNPAIIMDEHATDGNRHLHPLCYGYGNNLNDDKEFEHFNRLFAESIYGVGIGTHSDPTTNWFQNYLKPIIASADDEPLFASNYYPLKNAIPWAIPYTEGSVSGATLTSGNGHGARYTSNLPTIKNRIGLLYECHSHNAFRFRVHTHYAATLSTFDQAAKQKDEILSMIKAKDTAMSNRASVTSDDVIYLGARSFISEDYDLGVGVGMVKVFGFNGSDYNSVVSRDLTNNSRFYPLASNPTTRMGALYIMDAAAESSAELLLRHGVKVYKLKENITLPVDDFVKFYNPSQTNGNWTVTKSTSGYEGHNTVTISAGEWNSLALRGKTEHVITKEHYVISTAQPFGVFAAYMLEPRADDSFCWWGFWDGQLYSTEQSAGGSFDIIKTYDYASIPASALEQLILPEDMEQAPLLDGDEIKAIFAGGIPSGFTIGHETLTDGTIRYFLVPVDGVNEALILDGNALTGGWELGGVDPYVGTNWELSIVRNQVVAAFTGKVDDAEAVITLLKYHDSPSNEVEVRTLLVKFSGEYEAEPTCPTLPLPKCKDENGCEISYMAFGLLALAPFFFRKKK
ncbi:MAG: hypothetical protein FWF87_02695 [Synergistaceae bacterium]|nr:hypothetical protein [Synergistaceae bacterium]